jgi:hypothetical protein
VNPEAGSVLSASPGPAPEAPVTGFPAPVSAAASRGLRRRRPGRRGSWPDPRTHLAVPPVPHLPHHPATARRPAEGTRLPTAPLSTPGGAG